MATYSVYSGGESRATHNLLNKINGTFQPNGSYLMGLTQAYCCDDKLVPAIFQEKRLFHKLMAAIPQIPMSDCHLTSDRYIGA